MQWSRCFFALLSAAPFAACSSAPSGTGPDVRVGTTSAAIGSMSQVMSFGSNPGNLLMYTYVPDGVPPNAPVVLALHGCTETASAYEDAGWNQIADKYKLYVVYPQQQSSNNTESCFNWFGNTSGSTADITRGQGEAESIAEMVDYMKSTYSVDPKRVFATGFSAGAAYAVALLALYPDVFAAGASFSGIPFGCATSLTSAYTCMDSAVSNTPQQWGALVRAGYAGYTGPYPRISVWQGSSDYTVNTANLGEIVSQWTDVTGAPSTPTSTEMVSSATHDVYADAHGVVQVESYSVSGMGHAVSIDVSAGCGTADTYAVDEHLCAADYAARFFGLAPQVALPDGGTAGGGGAGGGSGGGGGQGGGSGGGGGSGAGGGAGSGGGGGAASGGGTDGGAFGDAGAEMPGCSVSSAPSPKPWAALFGALACGAAFARRRTRRGSRGWMRSLAIVGPAASLLLAAPNASAGGDPPEEGAASGDVVARDAPPNKKKEASSEGYLGPQGVFFTGATVSALPAVLLGYFPVNHLATTVGLGFTYNANGSPTSPLTGIKGAPNNTIGSDVFLDVLDFVHDKAPFAMGPELNFIGLLSPNYPFTAVVVSPLWALRYAPWKAPISIGTGLGVSFTFVREMKPMVGLATQGLDIAYAF